jgi:hypothetical protein
MNEAPRPRIYAISDGRGSTCLQLVKAALVQFPAHSGDVELRSHVDTPEKVRAVIAEAAQHRSVIFFTLVSDATREEMRQATNEHPVPTVDLLGPAFAALHDVLLAHPFATPGLLYESDREHFDRMEAIDYTLKHDDGQRPHELSQADVVLVGVSRASKSSTCFFLAYAGIRAANVPIVPEIQPPQPLLDLDPERVIGLRINALRLRRVRAARVETMGHGAMDRYLDTREIQRELSAANLLMARHGWRTIDVSYKAVEEIAKRVVALRNLPVRVG